MKAVELSVVKLGWLSSWDLIAVGCLVVAFASLRQAVIHVLRVEP